MKKGEKDTEKRVKKRRGDTEWREKRGRVESNRGKGETEYRVKRRGEGVQSGQ